MSALAEASAPALAAGCAVPRDVRLTPVSFAALPGWSEDDHGAALLAFRRSASAILDGGGPLRSGREPGPSLRAAAAAVETASGGAARAFFEACFQPWRIQAGLLTGYYEPEIEARRGREGPFRTPFLARPDDLVSLPSGHPEPGLKGLSAARRHAGGRLEPYPERAAIEDGALAGRGLELAYVADPVDAFFAHIQGSVRLRLPSEPALRLTYAGRNGHPFTAIGRLLVERGLLAREAVTMDTIRAWLAAHPQDGHRVMRQNRSYIFFRIDDGLAPEDGPRGGQGIALTPTRSLAVDRSIWPYGLPFWLEGSLPDPDGEDRPLRRLVIAQDTGSAILGPARGDLFLGTGAAAGAIAGRLKHPTDFTVLLPRADRG